MKSYKGGQPVGDGTYLNTRTLEFVSVTKRGILPGGPERRFIWVPRPMVIMAGPLIGLGYVLFMPLIGPVLLAGFLAGKLLSYVRSGGRATMDAALPSWAPGTSHLLKRNGTTISSRSEREQAKNEADEILDSLEREVTERRERGER